MKANRSISMTLLVLMLVGSWSVPADAGLLDRLCRIGRARSNQCQPGRLSLVRRWFRKPCQEMYQPPQPGLPSYCPVIELFRIEYDGQCILKIFEVYTCNLSNNRFVVSLPCEVNAASCYSCFINSQFRNAPLLMTVDAIKGLNLAWGKDRLRYSREVNSVKSEVKDATKLSYTKNINEIKEFVDSDVVVEDGASGLKKFRIIRLTRHNGETVGIGFRIPLGSENNQTSNVKLISLDHNVLQINENLGSGTWTYIVYDSPSEEPTP